MQACERTIADRRSVVDGSRRDHLRAIDALRELIIAGEQFRQKVADTLGIGVTDAAAISHLYARGDLSLIELAQQLRITGSSATSLMDRLEKSGLASRTTTPRDRRRTIVHLTPSGHDAIRQSRHQFLGAFDTIPADELHSLVATLTDLTDRLQAATNSIPGPESSRPDTQALQSH